MLSGCCSFDERLEFTMAVKKTGISMVLEGFTVYQHHGLGGATTAGYLVLSAKCLFFPLDVSGHF